MPLSAELELPRVSRGLRRAAPWVVALLAVLTGGAAIKAIWSVPDDRTTLYPNDYSDHFSHYQATVLFLYRGMALFERPVSEVCNHPDDLLQHQPVPRGPLG